MNAPNHQTPFLIIQSWRLSMLVFSTTAFRIICVLDPTSVVGENTNNGKHCEFNKLLGSSLDHTKSETAAVGVFTNSFPH